tara:strand:+ start:63 stop:506 length:444 start_codon:yes stop_codon:yes gene_type:complete
MLAELAAANAAFSVIKSFVSNGKELASCGKQISDFVLAKENIEKEVSKQKAKGVAGADLDEFMALEELKRQEEELKQIMIYVGRPGLWADWQKFQAEARKARREQERLERKKREEIMTVVQWVVGVSLAFIGLVAVIYFAAKWAGRI